jgi:hypothetical protein
MDKPNQKVIEAEIPIIVEFDGKPILRINKNVKVDY